MKENANMQRNSRKGLQKNEQILESLPVSIQTILGNCALVMVKNVKIPKPIFDKFVDELSKAIELLENNLAEALSNKKNIEPLILKAEFCAKNFDKFLNYLVEQNQFNEALIFGKKLRKHLLELNEFIQQGKEAKLVKTPKLIADPSAKLVDINLSLIRASIALNEPHRTLAYIDESLTALDNSLNDADTLREGRFYFNSTAVAQFLAINNFEDAFIYLDKSIRCNRNWSDNEDFIKSVKKLLSEVIRTNQANHYFQVEKYCAMLTATKKEDLIKYAKACLSLLTVIQKQLPKVNTEPVKTEVATEKKSEVVTETMKEPVNERKQEIEMESKTVAESGQESVTEKKTESVAEINSTKAESTKVTKPAPCPTGVLPSSTTTMLRSLEDEKKSSAEDVQIPKIKVKTRKPANHNIDTNNNNATPPASPSISDAEKYGFDASFANERIYPFRSNLIPEGTYYGFYPKTNLEIELPPGAHKKNMEIVQDGLIGADGNRIRYNKKKKDAFKIGKKRSNSRFFSRIAQEVVVNGKRRVLLSFEAEHNHNTQQVEYEKKPK